MPSTNTLAPIGRESTLSDPATDAGDARLAAGSLRVPRPRELDGDRLRRMRGAEHHAPLLGRVAFTHETDAMRATRQIRIDAGVRPRSRPSMNTACPLGVVFT